jgi:poly-gamma-glutamate synthesis protein (capsule biosynthesis protein)
MKKHITVTIVLLLIISGVLFAFFQWRKGLESETTNPTETKKEQTNGKSTEAIRETEKSKETSAEKSTEADTTQSVGAISMIFTGDVLFANSFSMAYGNGGITKVVSSDLLQELNQANITMVNEEFPFSSRGAQMENKQYTFRADPSNVKALKEMGVDIVTLANNHILDFGKDALEDTFQTLDGAGILYAGAGTTAQRAKACQTIAVNGKKIGFLAASRVIPEGNWNVDDSTPGVFATYDGTALSKAVTEAKKVCDFVVVFVHWGVEQQSNPEDYQKNLAKQYIDAGADLVVGCHTHCLQGIDYYKGKPIYYSLGNFIFGSDIDKSMAIKVTVGTDQSTTCQLIPIYATKGCTSKMDASGAASLYQYMESISTGIHISEDGTVQTK